MITQMAIHTAFAWLTLSLGTLLARPNAGVMKVVMGTSYAGLTARRLLLPAIIVPVAVGRLILVVVPFEKFQEIVGGKRVEMKLGATELQLSAEALSSIRAFASCVTGI
jgi:hypothetical protein